MRLMDSARRHPGTLVAILIGMLATLATFGPQDAVAEFAWRAADKAAWPLTLLSAHLVHLGAGHLAVNVLAAVSLGWTCDRFGLAGRLPAAVLVSFIGVDLGLVCGPWPVGWYVGLSGGLHGVFAWLTLTLALSPSVQPSKTGRMLAAALLVGGMLKVAAQLAVPVGGEDWRGIPLATPVHVYGYLAGVLWALLRRVKNPSPARPTTPNSA
jgi:membrane associated rhomboid family serine protease